MSITSHGLVTHQSPGNSSGGGMGLSCQQCGAPIERSPCQRAHDRLRFCSPRCVHASRRLIAMDDVARIVGLRALRVAWAAIARELHVSSVATVQRACRRVGVLIELPLWVLREVPTSDGRLIRNERGHRHER